MTGLQLQWSISLASRLLVGMLQDSQFFRLAPTACLWHPLLCLCLIPILSNSLAQIYQSCHSLLQLQIVNCSARFLAPAA